MLLHSRKMRFMLSCREFLDSYGEPSASSRWGTQPNMARAVELVGTLVCTMQDLQNTPSESGFFLLLRSDPPAGQSPDGKLQGGSSSRPICELRLLLTEIYAAASNAQAAAVQSLSSLAGENDHAAFEQELARAKQARRNAKSARLKLQQHLTEHGC
jgi:hypothetical protein